jgi:hypothetical protein
MLQSTESEFLPGIPMDGSRKRWTVNDRDGNPIYLTQERWKHIIGAMNHPEIADYEEYLRTTIGNGRRRQEPLNPRKYRYSHWFDGLPDGTNHLVAIVLFGYDIDDEGHTIPNNFVATAFFKHIQLKGK